MPKTETGWTLDDSPLFTNEQWEKIQILLQEGKKEEAEKLIKEIINSKNNEGE